MWKLTKTNLVGLAAIAGLLVSSLVAVSPAQAYGNLDVFYAEFNPNTCTVLEGNLQIADDGRCRVDYVVDGRALHSWFEPDANSRAVAVRLWNGSQLIGFVEFHPYGEILYVVDTENDGDAIYVEVWVENPDNINDPDLLGVFTPKGTSEVVDVGRFNFNIADGRGVDLIIIDEADAEPADPNFGVFLGFA